MTELFLSSFDSFKNSFIKKNYLFYDTYKVHNKFGFIEPGSFQDYVTLVKAYTMDDAIYLYFMKHFRDKIDWNILYQTKIQNSRMYKKLMENCPATSFRNIIIWNVENQKLTKDEIIAFMKSWYVNSTDQSLNIAAKQIDFITAI